MGNQQIKKLASFTESLVILTPFTSSSGYQTQWFIKHARSHTHTHTLPQPSALDTQDLSVSFYGYSTQHFENDTFPNKDSIPQTYKHKCQLSSTKPFCESPMRVTLTMLDFLEV